jgi:SAM-dependent methyltransferase
MHYTALKSGEAFSETYGIQNGLVVDIGGRNVNGSLRNFFETRGMKFICVDMESDSSVDIVVPPGEKLPFEDGSVDLIVSTSCFEHDPCFWLTFKEMTRIIKPSGYIYINAPAAGPYHMYPGDNWRFYSDAGQALAYWSGKQISNETIYPVKVVETFNIMPKNDIWNDFICVWKRVNNENIEKNIIVHDDIKNNIGVLEQTINKYGLQTRKTC